MEEQRGGGSKFVGLGIAVAVVAIMVLLPFFVVVGFYAFANVQAIVTGSDLSSKTLNVGVFLTVLVGMVALFILGLFGLVSLIGRSFSPRRRKEELGSIDLDEI